MRNRDIVPLRRAEYNHPKQMIDSADNVTQLLSLLKSGNRDAEARLFALIGVELRQIARRHLSRERKEHTLQVTALVNETYMKLAGQDPLWQNRAHFLAVASRAMRQILVDYARNRASAKRNGGVRVELLEQEQRGRSRIEDMVALEEALSRLSEWDARQCKIVEMRFFGGLTEDEIAEVLGISSRTVKREWKMARAWLHDQIGP